MQFHRFPAMDSDTFSELADLTLDRSGQVLHPGKLALYDARLMPLLRREGFSSAAELAGCIRERGHEALGSETVGRLVNGGGRFFSDPDTLSHCVDEFLVARAARQQGGKLRIWCAGAGHGQEAYSLAILIGENEALKGLSIDLLATDMSTEAVERTRAGTYSHFEIQKGLAVNRMLAHFRPLADRSWQAMGPLRNRIAVRVHNLLDSAEGLGRFDLILCRRVMSSMAPVGQMRALETLSGRLLPGGLLVTGDDETIGCLPEVFETDAERHNLHARAGETAGTAAAA